jgi:hypothetical protein
VSEKPEYRDEYYFYLVMHSENGKSKKIKVVKATDLYADAELQAESYLVRLHG